MLERDLAFGIEMPVENDAWMREWRNSPLRVRLWTSIN